MADREKLIELLEEVPHPQRLYPDLYVDRLIANGVTVRERGRWIEVDDGVLIGQGKHYECSKCGTWTTPWRLSDYCPYCGAKMDGDGNG